MMKICQINCIYGLGSTGKLTRDIHLSLLKYGYDSIVIAPLKNQYTNDPGVYVVSNKFLSYSTAIFRRVLGMQFDWGYIQALRIIRNLKKVKPNIVHLHCINGNNINIYVLLKYLAKKNIKTLYTLHAEFPYTGGCGNTLDCDRWKTGCGSCPHLKYATKSVFFDGTRRTWRKQSECYSLFDKDQLHFTAVSPWLLGRAEESSIINRFQKVTVMNGVDTTVFNYGVQKEEWRNKLKMLKNEIMVLYVTASFFPHQDNLKGGRFILELAKRFTGMPIKIIVAANYGDDSNLPSNLIYVGRTKTQEDLAELYRESNLTILTSRNETFGMPVAESLCCGTPVVGFKAGGPESIALADYSEFVTYSDVDALEKSILSWVEKPIDKKALAIIAEATYSKEAMTSAYIKQYKNLFS